MHHGDPGLAVSAALRRGLPSAHAVSASSCCVRCSRCAAGGKCPDDPAGRTGGRSRATISATASFHVPARPYGRRSSSRRAFGDGEHAGAERDLSPRPRPDTRRRPSARGGADDLQSLSPGAARLAHHLLPEHRVRCEQPPLGRGQRALLLQDLVRDPDLADVVEQEPYSTLWSSSSAATPARARPRTLHALRCCPVPVLRLERPGQCARPSRVGPLDERALPPLGLGRRPGPGRTGSAAPPAGSAPAGTALRGTAIARRRSRSSSGLNGLRSSTSAPAARRLFVARFSAREQDDVRRAVRAPSPSAPCRRRDRFVPGSVDVERRPAPGARSAAELRGLFCGARLLDRVFVQRRASSAAAARRPGSSSTRRIRCRPVGEMLAAGRLTATVGSTIRQLLVRALHQPGRRARRAQR